LLITIPAKKMGSAFSTPKTSSVTVHGISQIPRHNSQIYIEKLTPRSFSVVCDTAEDCIKVIATQIGLKLKTENINVEQTIEGEYFLGIDNVYFKVEVIKQSVTNKHQASVTIKI